MLIDGKGIYYIFRVFAKRHMFVLIPELLMMDNRVWALLESAP